MKKTMDHFIKSIHVKNFKTIRDCTINECRRLNVFIGKNPFGSTHVMEALSSFSIFFLRENTSKNLTQLIRLESETELFYNGDYGRPAVIEYEKGFVSFSYNKNEGLLVKLLSNGEPALYNVDEKLNIRFGKTDRFAPNVRKYTFKANIEPKRSHSKYLIPPYGNNVFGVIERDDQLKREVVALFSEYGLNLVFDRASQSLKIMQSEGQGEIFLIPYNSIADTLQRIIFFKTAVASNNDCVLLFEEPEAHSFPPYMSHITQEMIHKKSNQYFVATHSPFILNDFLENARDELAVFMVHYEDHETKLRKLSDDELHEIYQHGVDLFTNSESYI